MKREKPVIGHKFVSVSLVFLAFTMGCATTTRQRPSPAPPPPPLFVKKAVVVFDFEGGSIPPRQETNFWRQGLATLLIADLRASDNLRLIDRHQLEAVLFEQALSTSDLASPATRLRIGKLIGADYFIVGNYLINGNMVTLDVQMFDVETGDGGKSGQLHKELSDMGLLSRKLSIAFLTELDNKLAREEEKRLALYGGPPLEAVRHYAQGLDLESRGHYSEAEEKYLKALEVHPDYQEALQHFEYVSQQGVR